MISNICCCTRGSRDDGVLVMKVVDIIEDQRLLVPCI